MQRRLSLGLKIALAFVFTVAVAVCAVSILANLAASRHFEDYVSQGLHSRASVLLPLLADYYTSQGSWDGVEQVMGDGAVTPARGWGRGMGAMMGSSTMMPLLLADRSGVVVYSTQTEDLGQKLGKSEIASALPVGVGGETVGYLRSGSGPQEEEFRQQLNRSILGAGVLAALVALLFGLGITRAMLKPLQTLRLAAQEIGGGQFDHRVPVASQDEIGDLARVFNEMAEALQRDEEWRRQMMADIAHELRTPVTVMRGQVEALQDGIFELDTANLQPLHDQTLLLGRLIDDLRDLALAEAGQLPLNKGPLVLDGLVRRVTNAFQPAARAQQQRLTSEIPDGLPTVEADGQRIEQVLGNLLSNALRYTPAGGSVAVRLWQRGSEVCCSVMDSGPGIAPGDMERIFDRFYRTDRARTRAQGGTGLGLAIARRFVQAHGGELTAESTLGQGTTFTFCLPRASSDTAEG